MAGIMNKTARQFNLKVRTPKGHRAVVRVAPGFNVIDDEHWSHFKNDKFTNGLKKDGLIDFGPEWDDEELERNPDTKAKSKVEKITSDQDSPNGDEADKANEKPANKTKAEKKAEKALANKTAEDEL